MTKAAILLANGFETIEALAPADAMKRAGIDVTLVSITPSRQVISAQSIHVITDTTLEGYDFDDCDVLVLPGGQPGTSNLHANPCVCELVKDFAAHKKIAAICAAPSILAELGLLEGRTATCYPGCDDAFPQGVRPAEHGVYVDGNIITASGPGFALDFGLELVRQLKGTGAADKVADGMLY